MVQRKKVMSLKDYLGSKGVADPISDWTIDKIRGNRQIATQRGKERFKKAGQKAIDKYHAKRQQAIKEYNRLIKAGKVREPTTQEKLIKKARGNSDRRDVQAARRVLKRKGISWKKGSTGSRGG